MRDDINDGGAIHFYETVKFIKELNPEVKVECLIQYIHQTLL